MCMERPSPNEYDVATWASMAALLLIAYVVFSSHLLRVAVWFTVFTIFFCWVAYYLYRWTLVDPEHPANTR